MGGFKISAIYCNLVQVSAICCNDTWPYRIAAWGAMCCLIAGSHKLRVFCQEPAQRALSIYKEGQKPEFSIGR